MVATANLSTEQVARLLAELADHPVSPEAVRSSQAYNPNDPHQDPEMALLVESDGLPAWWPARNPETNERMSLADRRRWCLEYLAGAWTPMRDALLSENPSSRRLATAQSLLLTHSEISSGGVPTPG